MEAALFSAVLVANGWLIGVGHRVCIVQYYHPFDCHMDGCCKSAAHGEARGFCCKLTRMGWYDILLNLRTSLDRHVCSTTRLVKPFSRQVLIADVSTRIGKYLRCLPLRTLHGLPIHHSTTCVPPFGLV